MSKIYPNAAPFLCCKIDFEDPAWEQLLSKGIPRK